MTKEQAIDLLDNLIGFYEDNQGSDYDEALKLAIKVLEQQPCEDAISRQAVLAFVKEVNTLPPVTPQPKTGRWIEHFDESGKWYECDRCHTDWGGSVNYCPNCGAKMTESEET